LENRKHQWELGTTETIRALVATTGLVALAIVPALAADLGAKPMYSGSPPVAPVDNWAGFYIGAMGGYGKENTSDVGALSGGLAGGTAGYNWQTGSVVLGLEADAA
jgi:outer membrane immunogenic protein